MALALALRLQFSNTWYISSSSSFSSLAVSAALSDYLLPLSHQLRVPLAGSCSDVAVSLHPAHAPWCVLSSGCPTWPVGGC